MSKLEHAGASSTMPAGFASANACSIAFCSDVASCSVHGAGERRGQKRPRFADGHDGSRARGQRFAQQAEIAALEPAADNRHQPGVEALDRPQRGFDVGRLRVVDEPDAADVGDELHRVLETVKRFDGRRQRRRRAAGNRADRRRRHDIADQMRSEQMDGVEGHEPHDSRGPGRTGAAATRRRSTIQPSSIAVPSSIAAWRANSRCRARPFRARSRTAGSSALMTAQSAAVWFSKILAFAAP